MPDEPQDPIILVPADRTSRRGDATVDDIGGDDPGARRGWWLVAGIAGVLVVGALVVNSQIDGTDQADESELASSELAEEADSESDEQAADEPLPAQDLDGGSAGDSTTATDAAVDPDNAPDNADIEHPVSGVEPHIPSRVRSDEPGPPAGICTGEFVGSFLELPLRFADTKPEGIDHLTWSPDCRQIAFRVGSTLWTADGDGTGDLPFLTAQHGLSAPAWSPDSEWIAFSQSAIVNGERASHIFVVRPDASGLGQITSGAVFDQRPSWSPDGAQIIFSRRARVGPAPAVSEGDDELSDAGSSDAGSSDAGPAVAEPDNRPIDQHLVVVDRADGTETLLAAGGEWEEAPTWSPDGEWIAFNSVDAIWTMHPDGSGLQRATEALAANSASWSPDGSLFAVVRDWQDDRGTLVIVEFDSLSEIVGVVSARGSAPDIAPTLGWTSDSQRVVFYKPDDDVRHWAYSVESPY